MDAGNDWVYVREWHGNTCVAHYRADPETARRYIDQMRGRDPFVWFSIDPMPSYTLPCRPLPLPRPEQATP